MIDIISEIIGLSDKYGEEFNWGIVPKENGFPRYIEFFDVKKVVDYIENQFIEEYL